MMIKAVIFDMDGLMIDSERVTFEGFQHVLELMNLSMSREFYIQTLGKTLDPVKMIYREEYGPNFPVDKAIDDVHQYIWDVFEKEGVPLKEGLLNLLKYLKDNHYQTIVATSSGRQRVDRILKLANISSYFDDSICGDEVENGKPYPEVFLKACEKLGVSTNEAIVLEDSEAGIEAAYRAHIPVLCIPDMKYPEEHYQKMTTKILPSLNEVIDFIKN